MKKTSVEILLVKAEWAGVPEKRLLKSRNLGSAGGRGGGVCGRAARASADRKDDWFADVAPSGVRGV